MKSYQEIILKHYEVIFNNSANIYLWDKGPFEKLPFDFRVLEFAPTEQRNMWTYATCCMSQLQDEVPIELHMFSIAKDEGLIELLTAVAYFHRVSSKLDLNHTVNFGRPWQNESSCTHGFISLPYLDGPALENLNIDRNTITKFYWLIPTTEKEVEYKKKFGVEALEERFDAPSFNYLNPARTSLV